MPRRSSPCTGRKQWQTNRDSKRHGVSQNIRACGRVLCAVEPHHTGVSECSGHAAVEAVCFDQMSEANEHNGELPSPGLAEFTSRLVGHNLRLFGFKEPYFHDQVNLDGEPHLLTNVCPHLKVTAACRAQLIRATISPRRVSPVTAARFAQRRLAHHPFVPVANGRYSKQAASVWCVPTVLLDSTAGNRSAQVSRVPCCATLLAHMMVLARPSRTPHGCRTRGPSVYSVAGLGYPPSSRGPS